VGISIICDIYRENFGGVNSWGSWLSIQRDTAGKELSAPHRGVFEGVVDVVWGGFGRTSSVSGVERIPSKPVRPAPIVCF